MSSQDDTSTHAAIVRWLRTPDTYDHRPDGVELIETHISCVFLARELVYKLKKPVRYDFLDFSTIAAREQACRDEVRLNRRLAPDIYLGVVPVTCEKDRRFRLNGSGEVVDWLVKMRRLPAGRTLDALHAKGELLPEQVDHLAELLAGFYAGLAPVAITPENYRTRCLAHVRGNSKELLAVSHHLPREVAERVQGFQLQLLQLRPELFDERVANGRIFEGHGDLRPEHICFADPIAIFDCIEFNVDFRRLDVADELAFLAAECDFIGADWVGPRLLAKYQQLSGDRPPAVLIDFYKAYRAAVRAKVAALRADQVAGSAREKAAGDAAVHLQLADRYAASHLRPLVLVVGGLSGTGKSTLAAALADALGARLLRSDAIRRDLFGADQKPEGVNEGIYRPEFRQRVYDEMFQQAANLHAQRVSIVLDATFSRADQVQKVHALATDPQAMFLAVRCTCRPEVARERIARRLAAGHDPSEASAAIHDEQERHWQAWPPEIAQCQIDTEKPLTEQMKQVVYELARRVAGWSA